jgi:hypothetical protein
MVEPWGCVDPANWTSAGANAEQRFDPGLDRRCSISPESVRTPKLAPPLACSNAACHPAQHIVLKAPADDPLQVEQQSAECPLAEVQAIDLLNPSLRCKSRLQVLI